MKYIFFPDFISFCCFDVAPSANTHRANVRQCASRLADDREGTTKAAADTWSSQATAAAPGASRALSHVVRPLLSFSINKSAEFLSLIFLLLTSRSLSFSSMSMRSSPTALRTSLKYQGHSSHDQENDDDKGNPDQSLEVRLPPLSPSDRSVVKKRDTKQPQLRSGSYSQDKHVDVSKYKADQQLYLNPKIPEVDKSGVLPMLERGLLPKRADYSRVFLRPHSNDAIVKKGKVKLQTPVLTQLRDEKLRETARRTTTYDGYNRYSVRYDPSVHFHKSEYVRQSHTIPLLRMLFFPG